MFRRKGIIRRYLIVLALGLIIYSGIIFLMGPNSSKLYAGLLGLIILGLMGSWQIINKYPHKIIKVGFKIGVWLFVISFGLIEGLVLIDSFSYPLDNVEYVIVLGAGLQGDKPSLMLQYRLDKAYDILIDHPEAIVVLSGGQGADEVISEALAMQNYLFNRGLSFERMIIEDKSTSTYENLAYSMAILDERFDLTRQKGVYVTNDFHVFRTSLLSRSLDFDIQGVGSASVNYLALNYFIREYFGVVKALLF